MEPINRRLETFKSKLAPGASLKLKAVEKANYLARQDYLNRRTKAVDMGTLLQPDRCPSRLLDALAVSVGVEVWDRDLWTDTQKRELIKKTIEIKRKRGTKESILVHAKAVGVDAQVIDWFESDFYKYERLKTPVPYHFKVLASTRNNEILALEESRYLLKRIVDELKPRRTSFDLYLEIFSKASLEVSCAVRMTKVVRVKTDWREQVAPG